jgi:hypothetical protein
MTGKYTFDAWWIGEAQAQGVALLNPKEIAKAAWDSRYAAEADDSMQPEPLTEADASTAA